MTYGVIHVLGGLGLFLLGMATMTGALRVLADERLREALAGTVDSPLKGAVTGALSTAVLQSSSATTVAAVGFVGAGLLTFSESLGIIFGANIGTTMTGWLVALVGFKLDLGEMLLPMILIGALMRLFGRGRVEQIGLALAGFAVVFLGIDTLQTGLSGQLSRVTPDDFPPDTILGRLLLVGIGLVVTIVTQSSSAGVAMALTAVHTGTISLNQAAAMVIGMDVGTTATAVLATIGRNVSARRTGFAHVIYNSFTGLGAFLLLTPYMATVDAIRPGVRQAQPELVLVGFHTFFNTVGVIAVLPFTDQFARLLVRLFPERGNPLVQRLDRALLVSPSVALAASIDTLREIAVALAALLKKRLEAPDEPVDREPLQQATAALEEVHSYLQELAVPIHSAPQAEDYVAALHVLDHLRRIGSRLQEVKRLTRCRADDDLAKMSETLSSAVDAFASAPEPLPSGFDDRMSTINRDLKSAMRKYRSGVLQQASAGSLTTSEAILRMDTARTLRRLGYHLWRTAFHLGRRTPAGSKSIVRRTMTDKGKPRWEQ